LTERGVSRSLKSAVTARRPSTRSKTLALDGVSSKAVTRTKRVVDWIAGGREGGRRSRSSCYSLSDELWSLCWEYEHSYKSLVQRERVMEDGVVACLEVMTVHSVGGDRSLSLVALRGAVRGMLLDGL
jgi:hypothetical protein